MNEKSESKHALLSIKVIVCSLLFVPIWFFLYAFLHEAGHALVGLAYGGSIVNFVFWNFNAHVVINGAEYTAFGLALFHVAGLLLPILVYILALCFYNPKRKPVLYHICYIIATVSLIWSLASWVVMSFMSIFTILPGEDVWKFIDSTGFHPLLVTLMFFTLTVAFSFFAIAKGVFSQVVLFFSTMKNNAENKIITTDKIYLSKPKAWIISFSMLIVSIIIFITMFFIPYEPSSVLIDELIEDVREQPNIVYTYTVTESRMHSFDLKLLGKGFITLFNVYDNDGNLIFNWSAEELTSSFGLGLKEGEITLSFVFLTDYDSLVKHFEELGHSELINDEEWQRYRDVLFAGSDSYTASLFLRVR